MFSFFASLAIAFSAQASRPSSFGGHASIDCKSRQVMDAGYSVHVFYAHQKHFGSVYSETFAGEDYKYFNGPLLVRKFPLHNACIFQLTDSFDHLKSELDIVISSDGSGRILKLEGKVMPQTSNSFTDLACVFDAQLMRNLGCQNSSIEKVPGVLKSHGHANNIDKNF